MKEVYVGNLAYSVKEDELRDYFSGFGEVVNAKIITDRQTGQSKGFGFIEFASQAQAEEAASKTNGESFKGRPLKVNISRPKEQRGSGGAGGRGGYSGRGGHSGRGGW